MHSLREAVGVPIMMRPGNKNTVRSPRRGRPPGLPGGGGLPLRRGLGEYETLSPGRRGRLPLRETVDVPVMMRPGKKNTVRPPRRGSRPRLPGEVHPTLQPRLGESEPGTVITRPGRMRHPVLGQAGQAVPYGRRWVVRL